MAGPFVDAEVAARTLVNGMTDLVGVGNPMEKGCLLEPLRTDAKAYCIPQITGGAAALSAENPDDRASVSFLVHGRTREASALAATALANELEALSGTQQAAGSGVACLVADNVQRPIYTPDAAGPRHLVSAEIYFRAL